MDSYDSDSIGMIPSCYPELRNQCQMNVVINASINNVKCIDICKYQ